MSKKEQAQTVEANSVEPIDNLVILEQELKAAKFCIEAANKKITELETTILGKDTDIDAANKKITELEKELEALKNDIISNAETEKEQDELCEFCEIEEVEARTTEGKPIEYLIKGTDVVATVSGIIPAGQNAQFNETAVRVKIDGTDLTLTESLVKKVFVKKIEKDEKEEN